MKILMIADHEDDRLWGGWSENLKEQLSEIDLILSAGDLKPEYLEFLVTLLNVPLVYVRGNHDGGYDERPPEGCTDADGRIVEAEGLRILGLGGSMRYRPEAKDMYTEEEMQRRMRSAVRRKLSDLISGKKGIDILLTHAPCRGYGDMDDLPHQGFECFNGLLNRFRPLIHCYGHVHKEYGNFSRLTEHPAGTTLINASGYYILDTESI